MFKLRLFFIGLILYSFSSFSQKDFSRGYVIKIEGDTIKGDIQFKDVSNTPNECLLKIDGTNITKKFSKVNCKAFGSYEGNTYQLFLVNISLSKSRLADLSTDIDTSFKREHVFLKSLHEGKNVSLYIYTDDTKTRFYVKERKGEPEELLYYTFLNPVRESQVVYRNFYQSQLLRLSEKYNDKLSRAKMAKTLYNSNDLLKIVRAINGSEEEVIRKKEQSNGIKFNTYVGFGVSNISTDYEAKEQFLIGSKVLSKNFIVPFVSAGIDINFRNTFVRMDLEASINSSKQALTVSENDISELQHYGDRLEYKQYTATFSTTWNRSVFLSEKLNLYAGLGIALRYATTKDNVRTFSYSQTTDLIYPGADFKSITYQIPISLGLIIVKKIDASFSYLPSTKINSNALYSIKLNKVKLGINYRF